MSKDEVNRLAADLIANPGDASILSRARDAIHRGVGRDLLHALLEEKRESRKDEAHAIARTMAFLERLSQGDEVVGGWLMSQFYNLAGRALLHDICDAIDLWLDHSRSAELLELLRRDAAQVKDGSMQRKYKAWVSRMEQHRSEMV